MNKFDRQSRDTADDQPLPPAAARNLTRLPTDIIDLADAPPIAPRAPLSQSEVRTILVSLMLTMFLAALDQTIVATALPTIGRQFHDVSSLSWVITAYLLASTAVAPVFGTLSDIYGRRAMIIAALSLFIRGLGAVRAGAEHADADRRARPAGPRRRRDFADRADRDLRHHHPARARPVPGLFLRGVDCGRDRRPDRRRRVRRASALVDDLLDQRAARRRRAGAAAAEDGQDPDLPPQAQGRLVRRRAADGLGGGVHAGADLGRQPLLLAVARDHRDDRCCA